MRSRSLLFSVQYQFHNFTVWGPSATFSNPAPILPPPTSLMSSSWPLLLIILPFDKRLHTKWSSGQHSSFQMLLGNHSHFCNWWLIVHCAGNRFFKFNLYRAVPLPISFTFPAQRALTLSFACPQIWHLWHDVRCDCIKKQCSPCLVNDCPRAVDAAFRMLLASLFLVNLLTLYCMKCLKYISLVCASSISMYDLPCFN